MTTTQTIRELLNAAGYGDRPSDWSGHREVYHLNSGTKIADMTASDAIEFLETGHLPDA